MNQTIENKPERIKEFSRHSKSLLHHLYVAARISLNTDERIEYWLKVTNGMQVSGTCETKTLVLKAYEFYWLTQTMHINEP